MCSAAYSFRWFGLALCDDFSSGPDPKEYIQPNLLKEEIEAFSTPAKSCDHFQPIKFSLRLILGHIGKNFSEYLNLSCF